MVLPGLRLVSGYDRHVPIPNTVRTIQCNSVHICLNMDTNTYLTTEKQKLYIHFFKLKCSNRSRLYVCNNCSQSCINTWVLSELSNTKRYKVNILNST